MLGVRLLAVALLAVVVGIPVLAQESGDEEEAPPIEAPVVEAPPSEETVPTAPVQLPSPPTSTPRPAAAPTAVPGPGDVAFSDNFDDLTRPNFPLSSSNATQRSQGYIEGGYEIVSGMGFYSQLVPGTFANSTIAVDVRISDGPERAGVYLSCRRVGENGYQFEVLPARGEAGIRTGFIGPRFRLVRLQEGANTTLIDQGPSAAIRDKGELNHLELTCAGSTITGSVNGTEVFSVLDSTWTSGRHRFGVLGAQTRGRFDNLVVTLR